MEENKPTEPTPEKTGFLEEAPGQASSTRLMSFLCLLMSFAVAWLILMNPAAAQNPNGIWIFMLLMVGAFVPKAIHKIAELKLDK